ncbi:MAG: Tungstate uptake system permease protein TupB [Candidatus Poseidoniaceae archaeon]|nr:MAG: Tungstate uptake system permease protein TupB [Candidatus Poseidoniaceae archaeon]
MVDSTNLWDVVVRTLVTSGSATVLAAVVAIVLATVFANSEWKGKPLLRGVTQALYGLPPVVVGVIVYIALSRDGVFGSLNWLFTIQGMIIAQTILIFPLIFGVSWTALERVSSDKRDVLRVMNATPKQRVLLEIYCARRGIINAVLLGFGRAVAEVGAVLMVGGNIAGKTRVLTTSVVLETSIGRLDVALQIGLILLIISLITAFGLQLLQYIRFFENQSLGVENVRLERFEKFKISWENLSVEKNGISIVKSCTFDVSGNEIVALMGESGSGKTTLLRAMCGLEGNSNCYVNRLAFVPQNPVLVMDTVAMELGLAPRLHHHLPDAGKFFASICNFEEKGNQRTDSLSGGEIQRIAFLRALSMDRELLILDEATSELDGASVEQIEQEILSFKERGGAVVFATHNPFQAQRLADRVLFIHDGAFIPEEHKIAKQLLEGKRIG